MFSNILTRRGFSVIGVACLALIACGPAAGAQSAAQSEVTPGPQPLAQPTAAPLPSPTAAPDPPMAATGLTLAIDSSSSRASYHAHEQLVGKTLPSEAVGTSSAVSGTVVIGADGSIAAEQSRISVDLSKLRSDESRRDNFIKSDTLQTSRYPMATFVPREARGLPSPLPTSGELSFQLLGDLTVHGVTKPVIWQVQAQFAAGTVSGNATTNVNITDFGMSPPKAGPVLSIEDALMLELVFSATETQPTAASAAAA
jgi:polyisoprenoid-binding protein YceI